MTTFWLLFFSDMHELVLYCFTCSCVTRIIHIHQELPECSLMVRTDASSYNTHHSGNTSDTAHLWYATKIDACPRTTPCTVENFQERKLMWILRFCGYSWSFSAKFRGVAPLAWQSRQSMKVVSMKIIFFTNSQKFFPQKFPTTWYILVSFLSLLK